MAGFARASDLPPSHDALRKFQSSSVLALHHQAVPAAARIANTAPNIAAYSGGRRHVGPSVCTARDGLRDNSTAGAVGGGWGRGRRRVGFVDRRQEQITAAGDRLQDGLSVVGERNPDVADALHQGIIGHEDVGPNELHQFVFGNDATVVARQVEQYIERFGPQRHHLACAREACRVRIKREPAELKNHMRRCEHHQPLARKPHS